MTRPHPSFASTAPVTSPSSSTRYLLRLKLACLFGRFEECVGFIRQGRGGDPCRGGFPPDRRPLSLPRTGGGCRPGRTRSRSTRHHRKTLRHSLARLHLFAANSPHNFLHYEALLEAEAARASGHVSKALKHYDRAIELAGAEGYTHIVGLANERAALCCLANEHRRMAGWYLASARATYDKWGATAKVASLDREYAKSSSGCSRRANEATLASRSRSSAIRAKASTSQPHCKPRASSPAGRTPTACSRT